MSDDEVVDTPLALLARLKDQFSQQPIQRGADGRPVAFFDVTDFTTPIRASIIEDMASAIVHTTPLADVELIVSLADRSSGALAHAVARRLKIPYSLANWYPDGSPGEIEVERCHGFSGNGVVFLNGVKRGKRVAIVMDVMKTGTASHKLVQAVQKAGATVTCTAYGCEVLEFGGRQKLEGIPIYSMVTVYMRGEMTKEGIGSVPLPESLQLTPTPPSRVADIKKMSPEVLAAKMERVAATFVGVPIQRNELLSYPYSFFPLTDFVPALDPEIVEDMADLCVYYGDFSKCDVLVSEADRGGGPLVQAVALRTDLPYVLANWSPSGEGVGAASDAQVGFSGTGRIVVNGIKAEARCVFVDDMLSSGGTAEGVIKALVQLGGVPVEGVFISEKLYPPITAGDLPFRKGKARLNEIFPNFKVTTVAQFIAEGDTTKAPANRVGEY